MRLSDWLRRGGPLAAPLAIGLVAADPRSAQAQGTSDAPTVEELLREIEQLRRRVETLERQAAATAAAPAEPPPAEIGAIVVTEQEVERALERALAQTGALLLPAGTAEIAVGFVAADPRPAQAQGASDAPTVEELRRRVETLERQAAATTAAAPPAAAEPAPPEAAPPTEGEERAEVAPAEPPPAEIGAIAATEQEVERALERALVLTGALLLPAGTAEIEPNFSYGRQDAPVFLSEDGGQIVAADEVRSDSLETGLTLRVGLPLDSQLEVDLPYRYETDSTVRRVGPGAPREESRARSGFGDVSVTFTKALLRERGWRPNLFGSVRWDTDTGATEDGVPLGSGFHELSGSLTASKRQDPLVFVGGVGYTHAFEQGRVQPGRGVGLSFGTVLAASPETSLRFFLSQSFVDEVEVDGRKIPGSDQVVGTFIVGASSIISPRVLLDVTFGVGLTEDASDYFVSVSLPVQFDLPFRF